MGNIKCLQCNKEITTISGMSCPHCGAKLSHVLISFLSYLGPEDSLSGYQRSYKLVFLHGLFSELKHNGVATIAKVTERFRNFYLDRKRSGLVPDVEVDNRIQNVEGSSLRDIWIMIQMNPYAVISKKGFLTARGDISNGIFVLQKGLDQLTSNEIDGLLNLLNIKLDLYYRKIGSAMLPTKEFAITQVSNSNTGKTQTTPVRQQVIDSIPKKDSNERTQEKRIIIGKSSTIPTNTDDSTPLERILLSNRAYITLKMHGIDSLGQLRSGIEDGSLISKKKIDPSVLHEVADALSIELKMPAKEKAQPTKNTLDGSFSNKIPSALHSMSIRELFPESEFGLFRTGCARSNKRLVKDLFGTPYADLLRMRGLGPHRIKRVISRWDEMVAGQYPIGNQAKPASDNKKQLGESATHTNAHTVGKVLSKTASQSSKSILSGNFTSRIPPELHDVPVDKLFPELSFGRFRNACARQGIKFAHDLFEVPYEDFLAMNGLGLFRVEQAIKRWEQIASREHHVTVPTLHIPSDKTQKAVNSSIDIQPGATVEMSLNEDPAYPESVGEAAKDASLPSGVDENTPLEDISLSNRAYNALKRHGVDTLGQMRAEFESGSIAEIKNIGRTIITEIETLLSVPMQNTDLPTEPKQELPENIFDEAFTDTLGEEAPNVTIDDIFPDGIFILFRAFCSKRSIQYASDLIGMRYEELVKEKGFGKTKIAKIIERWEEAKNYIPAKTITKSIEEQLAEQLDEIAQDRNFDILIKRVSGQTLQGIADEYRMTRESVRQICIKIENKIYIRIRQLISILLNQNNSGYFREEQLQNYVDNEIYRKAIVHTLRERDEYFSFGSPAVFLEASSFPNAESDLAELTESIVGDGLNIFESKDAIDTAFEEAGYGFLGAEDFLELLIKYEYVFYGDYAVKNAKSYAKLCAQIVEDEFPEGITNSDEDMNRLRALAKERYGDLDIPTNNRSFFTRITVHLVLRGRSQYIAPRYIYADESIIAEIKAYIDAAVQRDLFYSEIYAAHEGLLLMMTNIDNPAFLHGVLTHYYPNEYTYSRDYLSKDSGEKALDLGERVCRYLKEVGHALPRKDLLQHFPGVSDVMLFNAVTNTEGLIQWDYNYYNHIDNIRLDAHELDKLKIIIESIMDANRGYCSETMLLKAVSETLPDFLVRNGNMNAQNVFYTCACLMVAEFDFKRPHIARSGRFNNLNVIEIAKDMLGNCDHIKASDYFRIAKKFMWPEVTASMEFAKLETDYIRLNQDEYIRKQCFNFSDDDLRYLRDLITTEANQNWFLALQHFNDSEDELPSGNGINEFFVGSLIAEYDLDWHIVSPQTKDRRYQRGILVHNSIPVYAYDELICKVLIEQGISTIEEGDLQALLQIHSLIFNYLPKELQKSAKLKYSNGVYQVQ